MRPTKSMLNIEAPKKAELSDEELAYLQTQKTLKEALAEQRILRDRLRTLEIRNKPSKWGCPVVIQSFETARNSNDNNAVQPERVEKELKTTLHMLENAKRATETAKAELRDLIEEIETFKKTSKVESDQVIELNSKHHKLESQQVQSRFNDMKMKWSNEKSGLLSAAEKLSMISHDALHKAAKMREQVENQRKKIQTLATEYRAELSKSKELRELLDDEKTKVNLTNNLIAEIDANKKKSEQFLSKMNEQKKILSAVKISQAANAKLDELAEQIEDLTNAKVNAEEKLRKITKENDNILAKEMPLKQGLISAENGFKKYQMQVFVYEAEIRELKSELQRIKPRAIEEGRKNLNLQQLFKKKNMDATMKYLIVHSSEVFSPERLASSIQSISENLETTTPLPPLNHMLA